MLFGEQFQCFYFSVCSGVDWQIADVIHCIELRKQLGVYDYIDLFSITFLWMDTKFCLIQAAVLLVYNNHLDSDKIHIKDFITYK